jgi:4-hydroxybenzoate polyprenyltransferase
MLSFIRQLLSLVRFSHTLFALPFALLAALMAWSLDDARPWGWRELAGILLAMVTARSAAMSFNRLVDRSIDADNPRTEGRHLPAGMMGPSTVRIFVAVSCLGFVASTLLFLPNRLPLYLALPVLAWLLGYSYSKRFTALAHFWLGAALAAAPVAVWIALRGDVVLARPMDLMPAVVLAAAVMAWVAGFDILYACQDVEYDRIQRLHSMPVRLGLTGALRLAAGCHLVAVIFLAGLPLVYSPFGPIYSIGVVGLTLLLAYEHALVRPDDLDRVNLAFFNVNALFSLGLLVIGTIDLCLW